MISKFKEGNKVRVFRKVVPNGFLWMPVMDKTIGKIYTIIMVSPDVCMHAYFLDTRKSVGGNWWFPVESLELEVVAGQQLEFDFMRE